MKFIFPQNYNLKNKLFGVFDYSTAIFVLIWSILVFFICNFIFKSINLKIFFIIVFTFPIILISLIGFNNENILYVFVYFFKFLFRPKVYLFDK